MISIKSANPVRTFLLLAGLLAISSSAWAQQNPAVTKVPKLPPAPNGVVIRQNVIFLATNRTEKLDLYLPARRASNALSPAVILIHGGGWAGGDKAASREFNVGTTLALAGYVCASINYSLKEGERWPLNLQDCKNAVRFLRANATRYQVDKNHFGVLGGSAGGHLALMVAYTGDDPTLAPPTPYPGVSDAVNCVVDLYGITDLLTRRTPDAHGNPTGPAHGNALFPESREESPEKWKQASPVYHLTKHSPPTLILHGLADATVDYEQSKELDRKLAEAGVEHQLILIPGIGHTFDLQVWNHKPLPQDLRPVIVGFFDKHLKP